MVRVPASGSVLMRISKLELDSIRLGSVTLKNRSLSRASLELLQPQTKFLKIRSLITYEAVGFCLMRFCRRSITSK